VPTTQAALDAVGLGLWTWTLEEEHIWVSPAAAQMLGYHSEQWMKLPNWRSLLDAEVFARAFIDYDQATFALGGRADVSVQYAHPDGSLRMMRSSVVATEWTIDRSKARHVVGTLRDVTASAGNRHELQQSRGQAKAIFDSVPTGLGLVAPNGRWIAVNQALCRLLGYSAEELMQGAFQEITLPEDLAEDLARVEDCLKGRMQAYTLQKRYIRKDGAVVPAQLEARLIRDDAGEPVYFVSSVTDLRYRLKIESDLAAMANLDRLTGLLNRGALERALHKQLDPAGLAQTDGQILFIDVDGFTAINDHNGHRAGDQLIAAVAQVLAAQAPAGALLGRWNADQFVMIVPGLHAAASRQLGEQLVDALYAIGGQPGSEVEPFTCSIGIATLDQQPLEPHAFVLLADYACGVAKRLGGGRARHYEEVSAHVHQHRSTLAIRREIEEILRDHRFLLYAQRIYNRDQQCVGREVLLRLVRNGQVSTVADLLAEAEQVGLIRRIDMEVFDRVSRLLVEQTIDRSETLTLNVSAVTLNDEAFSQRVLSTLRQHPYLCKVLKFEITESADITDLSIAATFLQALRDMGVGLLIDDFGSGFASFSRLRNLPVTGIKIDRCHISGIDQDAANRTIVQSIVEVAHRFGMTVVAEGVETREEFEVALSLGVDQFQGWLFHKASPLQDSP